MRIFYGKLGRSIPLALDDASNVGGDIEVVRLLHMLLDAGHEVHLIGRNRNDFTHPKLVNHYAPEGIMGDTKSSSRGAGPLFDAYHASLKEGIHLLPTPDITFIWLGQHGTSLHPVPTVQVGNTEPFTNPMGSDVNYGFPLACLANELGIRPYWLCPDPRNMIKFRDLWDPQQREILAQYNTSKNNTFYDERDNKLRSGGTRYKYSGIEMLAVVPCSRWEEDKRFIDPPHEMFGILVNEGYTNLPAGKGRLYMLKQWTKNVPTYEIFGHWAEASQVSLGRIITPVPLLEVFSTLQRWRATITLPATGGGWATSKPWECFNAGTICFKHPDYDSQGHIYSQAFMPPELYSFLCPPTQSGLTTRLAQLTDDDTWRRYVRMQYDYLRASRLRLREGARGVWEAMGI